MESTPFTVGFVFMALLSMITEKIMGMLILGYYGAGVYSRRVFFPVTLLDLSNRWKALEEMIE